MILPGSYLVALLLCVVAMLCWAVWPVLSRQAMAREDRWGFELFYFDFAMAAFLTSIVVALTVGSMGFDGFTFRDILVIGAKRKMALALITGAVGCLGTLLLLAAISVSGLAQAFVLWGAAALLVFTLWTNFQAQSVQWLVVSVVAALSITGMALAMKGWLHAYRHRMAEQASKVADAQDPASPKRRKKRPPREFGLGPWKAFLLAVAGGLLFGAFLPMTRWSYDGEDGLGPYATGVFLAAGLLGSTFIYNLFFMNLPVRGKPVDVLDYIRLNWKLHLYGLVGGVVWMLATASLLAALYAPDLTGLTRQTAGALALLAAVIGALVGALIRREFRDVPGLPQMAVIASCVVLGVAVGVLVIA